MRAATLADVPAVLALVEGGYRGESAKRGWTHEADLLGGQRTDADAIADIINDPRQTLLLLEQSDALVGCVLIADKGERGGDRIAYLGMLTVDPALQAGGHGRTLLQDGERYAVQAFGATVMEMTCIKSRTELIAWYLRRGYHDTGREEPFPLDDPRFGLPKTRDLVFVVLAKRL